MLLNGGRSCGRGKGKRQEGGLFHCLETFIGTKTGSGFMLFSMFTYGKFFFWLSVFPPNSWNHIINIAHLHVEN